MKITALMILFASAVYSDFNTGKIPNKLTISFLAAGLAIQSASYGWHGLAEGLGGAGMVVLLFLLFGNMAKIGGGDVKLMAAAGAITGFSLAVWSMLLSAVAGGILAAYVMIRYGILIKSAKGMAVNTLMAKVMHTGGGITAGASGIKIRYSPAIALGTLAAILWKGW